MTVDLFVSNLGDALWVTPLTRFGDLTVRMRKGDKRAEATAPIFDGIAKVELVDSPQETTKAQGRRHVTQNILAAHGFAGYPSIPHVKVTEGEILWAKGFLNAYRNPIVFINGNSANGRSNPRAQYVRPPVDVLKELVKHYADKGFTPLQFGPSATFYDQDAFEPLEGCVPIRGLNVRQLAACYSVIGKMVSGDTGDYHLMVSVGGSCATLVPHHSETMGYRHWDLLYDDVCWGLETPRITYLLHEDWEKAKEIYEV